MSMKFITFEGGEGSGKTTIIKKLVADLKEAGFDSVVTREPGGSKISEEIRNVILNVENKAMDYMTEALLYAASRRQHLEEVVKPAINNGKLVICDRYLDSSLAYQGHARGLGIENVYNINMYATDGFLPDLTIFLDVTPEIGLTRIAVNNRDVNRLDLEKESFHKLVREGYLKITDMYNDRIVRVDANGTVEEVYERVKNAVFSRLCK